jgi:hypothetical protein
MDEGIKWVLEFACDHEAAVSILDDLTRGKKLCFRFVYDRFAKKRMAL